MTVQTQLSAKERQALDQQINDAANAQRQVTQYDDMTLDIIMHEMLDAIESRADYWAQEERYQSGIGNVHDKKHKLHFVITRLRQTLTGVKTGGLVGRYDDMPEYADPVGVIFAISPLTGLIPNALYKATLALKTRNAIIISAPRGTAALGKALVDSLQQVLVRHGLPRTLITLCPPDGRATTHYMLHHTGIALNLVTGGSQLVRAAYASGRPTQGVGAGNVPVLVDHTADPKKVASDILLSKSYDNGILCGAESNVVVEESLRKALEAALMEQGAWLLKGHVLEQALDILFEPETHNLQKHLLGQDAPTLARALGHTSPEEVTMIILTLDGSEPYLDRCCDEKLACIMSLQSCTAENGIIRCKELIEKSGTGHTAVIHSFQHTVIEAFARTIPAGRILVNTPAVQGMSGITTRSPFSLMLGCGTYGGNITTDAIQWRHLVNLKRVAYGTTTG